MCVVVLDASNPRVISAYEDKIAELERQKLLTEDQVEQSATQKHPFEESFELACEFLANPYELWKNNDLGGLITKRVVLRLVFLEGLAYPRQEGVRTPQGSEPFRFFQVFSQNGEMAETKGV